MTLGVVSRFAAVLTLLPVAALAQRLVLGGNSGADSASAAAGQVCTSATVGSAISYVCINRREQELVAQHKAGTQRAGIDQTAAPPRLGLYNQAATREHLGSSFGHSVIPQAVPPPHYVSPLVPPR